MTSIRKLALALAACSIVAALGDSLAAQELPAAVGSAPPPVWLALGSQLGTCRTACTGPSGFTIVSWSATLDQCCSGNFNPCPPGSTPGTSSFLPNGGFARICPIN